ncbi:G-protein coupled receptor [Branchiostoma belcheri]|nr:G-protein coupled receptor [Branchiostoma belcheri]
MTGSRYPLPRSAINHRTDFTLAFCRASFTASGGTTSAFGRDTLGGGHQQAAQAAGKWSLLKRISTFSLSLNELSLIYTGYIRPFGPNDDSKKSMPYRRIKGRAHPGYTRVILLEATTEGLQMEERGPCMHPELSSMEVADRSFEDNTTLNYDPYFLNFSTLYSYDFMDNITKLYEYDYEFEEGFNSVQPLPARVILGIVYCLIMLVCGTGNSLLITAVCRFRELRCVANVLVANLALSDLLVAVFCLPFQLDYYIVKNESWGYGDFMCATVNYVRTMSLYVSTNVLVAIAIDRFQQEGSQAISNTSVPGALPQSKVQIRTEWLDEVSDDVLTYYIVVHRPMQQRRRAWVMIVPVWLTSMIFALPSAVNSKAWSVRSTKYYQAYYVMMFIIEYLVPIITMTYCHLTLWLKVHRRSCPGNTNERQQQTLAKSRRKTVTLVILSSLFVLCWGPYQGYTLVRDLSPLILKEKLNTTIFYAVEALAMGNNVVNTVLYVALNAKIRKYIKLMVTESVIYNSLNGNVSGSSSFRACNRPAPIPAVLPPPRPSANLTHPVEPYRERETTV